eukprot:gene20972-25182_t
MVHKDDEGFVVGPKEKKLGIKGSPTAELKALRAPVRLSGSSDYRNGAQGLAPNF